MVSGHALSMPTHEAVDAPLDLSGVSPISLLRTAWELAVPCSRVWSFPSYGIGCREDFPASTPKWPALGCDADFLHGLL